MMLSACTAIATSTFLEMARDKIIYASLLFACVFFGIGLVLGSVSVGQDTRITLDFSLAAMTIISGLIAAFTGSLSISREIDRRTIYWVLVRPVKQWQFILGKYMGLAAGMLAIIGLMGLFMLVILGATTGGAIFKDLPVLLCGFAFIYLEIIFVGAMAILFSTFAEPIMAVIFTVSFWLIGHEISSLSELGRISTNTFVSNISSVLYFALPDLETLTRTRTMIMSGGTDSELCLGLIAYTITYVIVLLAGAAMVTERKELP